MGTTVDLQDFDWVRSHPDIDLLKPRLQSLFEFDKEFAGLGRIRAVNEQRNEIVAVSLSLVLPRSLNCLGLDGDSTETLSQLQQRIGDQFAWDGLAVIELHWQEDFEPPKRFAHRWPARER
jgi:hypothetical protein